MSRMTRFNRTVAVQTVVSSFYNQANVRAVTKPQSTLPRLVCMACPQNQPVPLLCRRHILKPPLPWQRDIPSLQLVIKSVGGENSRHATPPFPAKIAALGGLFSKHTHILGALWVFERFCCWGFRDLMCANYEQLWNTILRARLCSNNSIWVQLQNQASFLRNHRWKHILVATSHM